MKSLLLLLLPALFAVTAAGGDGLDLPETRFAGERTTLLRNGAVLDFGSCLAEALRRHPAMEAEDVLKLCVQGARGPEHILGDGAGAERRFYAEFASLQPRPEEPLFEVIAPDFMRLNLGAWKARQLPPEWLFRLFSASAHRFGDGDAVLAACFADAEKLLAGERRERFVRLLRQYAEHPVPLHHSEAFRKAEAPSYRLVSTRFLAALPVLIRAAALPEKGGVRVIAIDGRAASGKTTLARQLAAVLKAEVVHMDDFFLPRELRTPERFREPGGNVHYERFAEEVLPHLRDRNAFSYRVFDCGAMDYGEKTTVRFSPWRIVEGAYSLHPRFGAYADLKVFCDISPAEQERRIVRRNGAARWKVFRDRWIPLEERYIRACKVRERADLILGGRR